MLFFNQLSKKQSLWYGLRYFIIMSMYNRVEGATMKSYIDKEFRNSEFFSNVWEKATIEECLKEIR